MFRTIAVLGFADAMRLGLDSTPTERAEYFDIMRNRGKHRLHLLNLDKRLVDRLLETV